jgi:transcription elongation GreA/GreB family factor
MSRAFVKEDDGGEGLEDLPGRLISEYRNLVTPEGLMLIEAEVARLSAAYAETQASADRIELQKISRDLHYWTSRRSTAEVVMPRPVESAVQFGSTVTIERDGGRRQRYRIVGEDEANPAQGTIAYVAPMAQALLGKAVGDVVRAGGSDAGIVEIA